MSAGMTEFNGMTYELVRFIERMSIHMERQTDRSEDQREASIRQAMALEQISQDLHELPERLSETMRAYGTQRESGSGMKDVADLLRSIYPYLMFAGVLIGKTMWPQYLPVIRAALEAAAKVHSGLN
jgi:hypothetical protein